MKKIIFVFLLALPSLVKAQNHHIQWAGTVLEFSSENLAEKDSSAYSVKQTIGEPDAFPLGARNKNAWEPQGTLQEEYIKVGFQDPIKPEQILIVESYHPGYISNVYVYDADSKEFEVAKYVVEPNKSEYRLLQINTALNFPVYSVKVVLRCDKNNPVGIDAIGVSGSEKFYNLDKAAEKDKVVNNNRQSTK